MPARDGGTYAYWLRNARQTLALLREERLRDRSADVRRPRTDLGEHRAYVADALAAAGRFRRRAARATA